MPIDPDEIVVLHIALAQDRGPLERPDHLARPENIIGDNPLIADRVEPFLVGRKVGPDLTQHELDRLPRPYADPGGGGEGLVTIDIRHRNAALGIEQHAAIRCA